MLTAGEEFFNLLRFAMDLNFDFIISYLKLNSKSYPQSHFALQHRKALPMRHKTDIHSNGQRKEADMGRAYSLNVLVVGAAFVFVASMLFI